MNDIAMRVAKLSPAKLELLSRRLSKELGKQKQPQVIHRKKSAEPIAPLSFAQERLWFIYRFEQGNSVYNIHRVFRAEGRLNLPVLERCLSEIVRRHETLRTTFDETEGKAVQIVAPAESVTVSVVDLGEMSPGERESESYRIGTEESVRLFDLTRGPLFRITLLRFSEADHIVLFTMHHIISDAWSMGVLVKELVSFYEAFSIGEQSPLGDLPVQYSDFARWQRQWLQGQVLDELLSYWTKKLAGANYLLELSRDRPRPQVQSFRGIKQSFVMPKALVDSLKRFSQNNKVTLYTTLLAVFNVMIYLDTSQEDILVGCPIANRSRSETEGLIGFFVNTLVMRTDLSGDPAFIDLVDRVREVALGAYSHQDLPFEKLVKALQPERNLSHTPLIQVVFNFNNTPDSSVRLSGLSLTPFDAEFTSVKFDLAMHVISTEKDLTVFVESSADLFTEATTRLILWRFRKLLEIALDRPTARLTELKKELGEADKEMWVAKERELKELRNLKFRGAKRKAVGRSHMRDQEEE